MDHGRGRMRRIYEKFRPFRRDCLPVGDPVPRPGGSQGSRSGDLPSRALARLGSKALISEGRPGFSGGSIAKVSALSG